MKSKGRKKLVFLLVCILVMVLEVFCIPLQEPLPVKQSGQIRVVSYNVKYGSDDDLSWQERKTSIVKQILNSEVDIIGLQEANDLWMHGKDNLVELLDGYAYIGVGRDDGNTQGEYTPIFYNTKRVELIDSGNFWLSETPEIPSLGWDAVCNRICTWGKFRVLSTGEEFMHYNTHFDHKGKTARQKSADLLLELIDQTYPIVLTGDFNVLQGSKVYDQLENSYLSDSKDLAKFTMSYASVNWFLPLNLRWIPPIDFGFVTKDQWQVESYYIDYSNRINRKPVSDHFPIIIDLILK